MILKHMDNLDYFFTFIWLSQIYFDYSCFSCGFGLLECCDCKFEFCSESEHMSNSLCDFSSFSVRGFATG
jgi:predicted nucleic acid binding AN1-type Zn finger protein